MRVYIGPYPNYNKKTKKTPKRKVRVELHKYDAWNADHTMALIILPLLKQLQKTKHGGPHTDDEDVPEELRSTNAPPKKNDWNTDDNWFKRWDWILAELIWTFKQLAGDNDGEDKFYSGKVDILWQGLDKNNNPVGKPHKWSKKKKKGKEREEAGIAFYTMIKGPKDTYKIDREGLDAHWARIRNGLRLFGKYYLALWD